MTPAPVDDPDAFRRHLHSLLADQESQPESRATVPTSNGLAGVETPQSAGSRPTPAAVVGVASVSRTLSAINTTTHVAHPQATQMGAGLDTDKGIRQRLQREL